MCDAGRAGKTYYQCSFPERVCCQCKSTCCRKDVAYRSGVSAFEAGFVVSYCIVRSDHCADGFEPVSPRSESFWVEVIFCTAVAWLQRRMMWHPRIQKLPPMLRSLHCSLRWRRHAKRKTFRGSKRSLEKIAKISDFINLTYRWASRILGERRGFLPIKKRSKQKVRRNHRRCGRILSVGRIKEFGGDFEDIKFLISKKYSWNQNCHSESLPTGGLYATAQLYAASLDDLSCSAA